jgi:hypothetical protein
MNGMNGSMMGGGMMMANMPSMDALYIGDLQWVRVHWLVCLYDPDYLLFFCSSAYSGPATKTSVWRHKTWVSISNTRTSPSLSTR